jgi:hypothetical protein
MSVEELRDIVVDYLESNILNKDDCCIGEINTEWTLTNRGHGITLTYKEKNMGAIIYMEEIASDIEEHGVATVMNAIYEDIEKIYVQNIAHKDIPLAIEPNDEMIYTAQLTKNIPEKYAMDDITYKELPWGITVFLKAPAPGYANAYTHIKKFDEDTSEEVINDAWTFAKMNTAMRAHFCVRQTELPGGITPPFLQIADLHQFADYFYLIDANILTGIAQKEGFVKMYILADSAYEASIICIRDTKQETPAFMQVLKEMFEAHNVNNIGIPPIVFYPDKKCFGIASVM